MSAQDLKRPIGIAALSLFLLIGSLISFTAGLSLLVPGSVLEPLWRLNPQGHQGLLRIGFWGVVLLFAASVSCAAAAFGLWRRAGWGHKIAIVLITINLLGDVANTVFGIEPKAIVGVPIALALLFYLMTRRVRNYFTQ
ncbi:MAG: hypothetical protein AABM67_14445 [Acidobacteriota bacterium]